MHKMTEFFRQQVSARPLSPVEMNQHQQHLEILPVSCPVSSHTARLLPAVATHLWRKAKWINCKKQNEKRKRTKERDSSYYMDSMSWNASGFLRVVSSSLTFLNKSGRCSMFVRRQWCGTLSLHTVMKGKGEEEAGARRKRKQEREE